MIIKDLPYLTEANQEVTGGSWHGCISIFPSFDISKILEPYSDLFNVSIVVDKDIFAVADKKDKTAKAKTAKASPKEDGSARSGSGFIQSTSSSRDTFPE